MIGRPRFSHERLGPNHDRASFRCSREKTLEKYFTEHGRARRDNDNSVSAVYVLLDTDHDNRIAGYFSLSNTSIVPSKLPDSIAKKLPRYESWGALKLGRMARDDRYPAMDLGTILVARAFETALLVERQSGTLALIVDAKNSKLAVWYKAHGFQSFEDNPLTLFITNQAMAAYIVAFEKP